MWKVERQCWEVAMICLKAFTRTSLLQARSLNLSIRQAHTSFSIRNNPDVLFRKAFIDPRIASVESRRYHSDMAQVAQVRSEEGWLGTPDGLMLYTKTWTPDWTPPSKPKARLVFLHGFSDHCNTYGHLYNALAQQGIKVYSFDQRGWGRSVHERFQRGLTGPNEQVMADITTFFQSLPKDEESIPLFMMGHSMGGGETIMYAANGPPEILSHIRGFLLDAPLIEMVSKPWKATVVLGKLAGRIMPHATMMQKLDPSAMSRDPAVCNAWKDDPLCHDTGTLEGLAGLLDRSAAIAEGRTVLREGIGYGGKTSLWLGHGMSKEGFNPLRRSEIYTDEC